MDNLAMALGVLAGLVQLAGYWCYYQAMDTYDGHKPNTTSWFMWAVGGVTELLVFSGLVEHEASSVESAKSKEILPAVCAVVVIFIFLRIWRRERTLKFSQGDLVAIALDTILVAFWFITKNPYASNLLLGLDMVVSFWPALREVREDPKSEVPKPWALWTAAYLILGIVVILVWESPWQLIYPVLYAILHGAVLLLSLRKVVTAAVL